MAQVAGLANTSSYAAGSSSLTGAGTMRAAALSPIGFVATIQGQRTTTEHFYTVGAVAYPMLAAVVMTATEMLAEQARINHFPNIESGDTYDSIQAGPLMSGGGMVARQVSVSTPQAKFLEFGFVHHLSGAWIFNPFMIPAADLVAPWFYNAALQVIGIAGSRRFFSNLAADSEASDMLSQVRAGLYSYSKWAGDIQALGFGGLSASRGFAIKGAKGLGDVSSIQAGTIGPRAIRRVAGRYGGSMTRISGGGFGTSRFLTGPSARIYNRISGRALGQGLKGFR